MIDQEIKSFKVYLENDKKIYIPKFFGLNRFRELPDIKYPKNKKIDVKFAFTLRDIQKNPAKIVLNAYKEKGGGILN